MIFKQHQQVLDKDKTQTRRLVKDGDTPLHEAPGYAELPIEAVYANGIINGRLRWRVGRTYAVQPGRGKKAVGRIRITGIRREWLNDISLGDIAAEGIGVRTHGGFFPLAVLDVAREEFARLWNSIYGDGAFAANPEVWALTFEVAK